MLRQGDRICFLGDSITAADPGYTRLVAAQLVGARPELDLCFVYAGVSGDRVGELLARLERDVLAPRPTVVTVSIGINDVWHRHGGGAGGGTDDAEFTRAYGELCARLAGAGIRGVLLTPTVIGEALEAGANGELRHMVRVVRAEAAARRWPLADMHQAFAAAITARRQSLPPSEWPVADGGTRFLTSDGVHMNPAGNALMAQTLLDVLVGPHLRLGGRLPERGLENSAGEPTSLGAVAAGRPLVAYWYPKDGTAGCTLEAQGFQAVWGEFQTAGFALCGLSADGPQSHRDFAARCGLGFPLLVDPAGHLARALGLWDETHGWTERATVLLAADGRLLRFWRDVRPEGHAQEVLATARLLCG